MVDSEKSIGGFFTTYFWIILIAVIIIFYLYLFGIVDFFLASFSVCSLGEGFVCKEYVLYSNETYGVSDGDDGDGINITIVNNFPYEIQNVAIAYGVCRTGYQDKNKIILKPGEKATIATHRCADLPSDSYIKSSVLIVYDVFINTTKYSLVQYGTISGIVDSSNDYKPYQKISYAISEWFRLNIG